MTDNRFEHSNIKQQGMQDQGVSGHDTRRIPNSEFSEELYKVSPVFRKLPQKVSEPAAEEWRQFSEELSQKLKSSDTQLMRTLRDKISASETAYLKWFWIVIALIVLFYLALIIGFSLYQPPSPIVASAASPSPQCIIMKKPVHSLCDRHTIV